jgi:hypothetical protein
MKQNDSGIRGQQKFKVTVLGIVSDQLADFYSGINITIRGEEDEKPETELIGWFRDQTALIGLLHLLHEWGHPLTYVECLPND